MPISRASDEDRGGRPLPGKQSVQARHAVSLAASHSKLCILYGCVVCVQDVHLLLALRPVPVHGMMPVQGLTAYALGSSILSSNASKERALSFICMFAFATPIGIFIGYLMATSTHPAGAAAISSLASGVPCRPLDQSVQWVLPSIISHHVLHLLTHALSTLPFMSGF